jgi:hypothetical protein
MRYWRSSGELFAKGEYGDGKTRSTYESFHPDGTLAQSNTKDLVKNVYVGIVRWTRVPTKSPENASFPTGVHDKARAYEFEMDADGYIVARRAFDAKGQEIVLSSGKPMPKRPPGVPTGTTLNEYDKWVEWHRDFETQKVGRSRTWDENGWLQSTLELEANGDRLDRVLGVVEPSEVHDELSWCRDGRWRLRGDRSSGHTGDPLRQER